MASDNNLEKPCQKCGGIEFYRRIVLRDGYRVSARECKNCIKTRRQGNIKVQLREHDRAKRRYQENKEAVKARIRQYRESNREEHLARQREYSKDNRLRIAQSRRDRITSTPDNFIKAIYHQLVKKAAKSPDKKKCQLGVTLGYIIGLFGVQNGKCALSGLQMTHTIHDLRSISVDRVDSNAGYIEGNIQLVCKALNYAKNDHSNGEIIEFIVMLRSVRGYLSCSKSIPAAS